MALILEIKNRKFEEFAYKLEALKQLKHVSSIFV